MQRHGVLTEHGKKSREQRDCPHFSLKELPFVSSLNFQQKGHRPVIGEADLHIGSEDTGGHTRMTAP